MTRRDKWTFQYKCGAIRVAIETRLAHHKRRLESWQAQRKALEGQIKESGLDIREHGYTGGTNVEVVIDPTLAKHISKCNEKITLHRMKIEEFERWRAAASSWSGCEDDVEELDIDDVQYFGL
jgi:hypothetical protein